MRRERENLSTQLKSKSERYEEQLKQKEQNNTQDKAYYTEELGKTRKTIEELSARNMELKLEGELAKGELEAVKKRVEAANEEVRAKAGEAEGLRRKIKGLEEQAGRLFIVQKALSDA